VQIAPVTVTGDDETDIFRALEQAASTIPVAQRAGAVILTDGQVHDIPADLSHLDDLGPVHTLITGRPGLPDRKLEIVTAPAYGLVGQSAQLTARIDSATEKDGTKVLLTITDDNGQTSVVTAATGTLLTIPLTIRHEGDNHIKLDAAALPDELTLRKQYRHYHGQGRTRPAARLAGFRRATYGIARMARSFEIRSGDRSGAFHHSADDVQAGSDAEQ